MSEFRIPDGVAVRVPLEDCANCHTPTPTPELAEGVCDDCRTATARAAAAATPAADLFTRPDELPVETEDELAVRRALRDAVKQAAVHEPHGWLQHAIETVRQECVRGRHGHEFTADTILEAMEANGAPLPEKPDALRFVMDQAVASGWCEPTGRKQPSRREERGGAQFALYRSKL